ERWPPLMAWLPRPTPTRWADAAGSKSGRRHECVGLSTRRCGIAGCRRVPPSRFEKCVAGGSAERFSGLAYETEDVATAFSSVVDRDEGAREVRPRARCDLACAELVRARRVREDAELAWPADAAAPVLGCGVVTVCVGSSAGEAGRNASGSR